MHSNLIFGRKSSFHFLILILVCYCSFFLFNGSFFVNIMEARNFVTAREIIEKGNWLVPTMNGELRIAKPPLPTWITAWFGMWFGMENLSMLRFPAGIVASLMVFFFYRFSFSLTGKKSQSLLNTLILSTSFYVFYMGRTGTWDIYCHSFMLGAIWALYNGWQRETKQVKYFVISGILLGLSFLSKGPVSFFALLIPFLIAYVWCCNRKGILEQWKPLLLAILIFLIISFWWPVYIAFAHANEAAAVAKLESGSWLNRHVRPFYYYWNFPIQSGIWTVLISSALFAPLFFKSLRANKKYRFALIWTLASVILLSFVPEKKDRYLLPVLIPAALLAGQLAIHLHEAFQNKTAKKRERIFFDINSLIIALVAFTVPILSYFIFYTGNHMSLFEWIFFSLFSELICVFLLYAWKSKNVSSFIAGTVLLQLSAILFLVPNTEGLLNKNESFRNIGEIQNNSKINSLNFYSIGSYDFRIELVYEVGKEVRKWDLKTQPEFPEEKSFVVFSTEKPEFLFSDSQLKQIELIPIGFFDYNRHRKGKRNKTFFQKYVSLVRIKSTNC